jgi:mannose-6-phosphate isomerase-like protein (cupin superfamily)
MDVQKYIESGVLEEYCLGLLNEEDQAFLIQMTMLYPEVKEELTAVELATEKLAESGAIEPGADIKQRILASLGFRETLLDINNLPAIDKNSDHEAWLKTLAHLVPDVPTDDFTLNVVRNDDHYQQMLVVTNMDVPEEDHDDFLESFFILKGNCECTVGNELFKLGEGDFLEVPLHVKHNIKITSSFVVAILQYQFV